jgi:acyl transferase domain-containing protein
VALTEEELLPLLDEESSVAAVNGARLCVAAGPAASIEALAERLRERGTPHKPLRTSHAFHSPMMDAVKEEFAREVGRTRMSAPKIPYVSNVTGRWVTAEEATSPDYWVRHMRQAVRFSEGLAELLKEKERVFLEVGPGRVLSSLARRQSQPEPTSQPLTQARPAAAATVVTSMRSEQEAVSDEEQFMRAAGQLWVGGAEPEWGGVWEGERRRRVPLPTYPFDRQRFWIEPRRASAEGLLAAAVESEPESRAAEAAHERPSLLDDYVPPGDEVEQRIADVWQEQLGIARVGVHDNFFELGGHSLLATQVLSRLREEFQIALPLGALFEGPTVAELAAAIEDALIAELEAVTEEEAESLLAAEAAD